MRGRAVMVTVLAALSLQPTAIRADFGLRPGDPTVQVYDAGGEPYAVAGGHPDRVVVDFGFNTEEDVFDGNAKDIYMEFPPGFSGNPGAVAACPRVLFEESAFGGVSCPEDTQIGVARLSLTSASTATSPIYNVETAPGQLALQGLTLFGKVTLLMRQRPDDFGVVIEMRQLTQTVAALHNVIELWGVPTDHHPGSTGPRRPFITLPPRCDQGPLTVTVRTDSWQNPGRWVTATGNTGVPLEGCDTLPFEPSLEFGLSSGVVDVPTGGHFELIVPQSDDPDGRASAAVRDLDVVLPAGIGISPGAVSRLAVCTDAQLRRGSDEPAACPGGSRVGGVELEAPQLDQPLDGDMYLGEERPGDRFRVFLVAEGQGVTVKFVGALRPDPLSGRITIELEDLPAVGFSRIGMDLGDAPALLATPMSCGRYTATASFERYDGLGAVVAEDAIEVTDAGGRPCSEPPFAPSFEGGTTGARAGKPTGLTLTLRRRSGEQLIDRFGVALPAGLGADFGAAQPCAEAAVVAVACPQASRIGSAVGRTGSGDQSATVRGDVYLTGPYRRAPFGLAIAFRAAIGRFDLGAVVVRAALEVDSRSGGLSVRADSLPRAIDGVPVRFQELGLDIDRTDFIRAPTSCKPGRLVADLVSTGGVHSVATSPFRLRGCDSLGFSPRFSVRLTGERRQLRPEGKPGVRIAVRAHPGEANLRSADIELPGLLRRDLGGLREICARRDALDGRCPSGARVGGARVHTPLFKRVLSGPVDLVQPPGDGLPELWATLDAEGARLSMRGKLFARHGRMHARLAGLPDLPLSRLVLQLRGGRSGLLSLAAAPCADPERRYEVRSGLEAHNDAFLIAKRRLRHPRCGGSVRARVRRGAAVGLG